MVFFPPRKRMLPMFEKQIDKGMQIIDQRPECGDEVGKEPAVVPVQRISKTVERLIAGFSCG